MLSAHMPGAIFDCYYSNVYGRDPQPSISVAGAAYSKLFGRWLPASKNASILDFGAGIGLGVRWLRDLGYSNAVGVDCSSEQCQMAYALCGVEVWRINDGMSYLQQHSAGFDCILMTDVIEHLPKPQLFAYLQAMRAALRPGGRLILKTDNGASPIGAYQYRMDSTHEYCFTERSLYQVLAATGFQEIEIRGEPYALGRRPSALGRALLRWGWWHVLKWLYEAERPGCSNPTIFSKSLVAACRS